MSFRLDRENIAIQKFPLKSQPDDDAYWKTRSVAERIAAVEFLRMQRHPGYDPATTRLQRIITGIKRGRC